MDISSILIIYILDLILMLLQFNNLLHEQPYVFDHLCNLQIDPLQLIHNILSILI